MNDICFYNDDRQLRMQWTFRSIKEMNGKYILSFDLSARISIFSAYTHETMTVENLITLRKDLLALYRGEKKNVCFSSLNDVLRMELKGEKSGRIDWRFHIKERGTANLLVMEDYFDRTFLPELADSMEDVLEERKELEYFPLVEEVERKEAHIRLHHFHRSVSAEYICFDMLYVGNVFTMSMESAAHMDELLMFKADMNALLEGKRRECVLNPLGEFYVMKMVKSDVFSLVWNVSDTSFPQNSAVFHENIDAFALRTLAGEIEAGLDML